MSATATAIATAAGGVAGGGVIVAAAGGVSMLVATGGGGGGMTVTGGSGVIGGRLIVIVIVILNSIVSGITTVSGGDINQGVVWRGVGIGLWIRHSCRLGKPNRIAGSASSYTTS